MLQIITGKFFTTDKLNVTHHRAVLYSNYGSAHQLVKTSDGATLSPVTYVTAVGSLTSTTIIQPPGEVFQWLYEVDEKLEAVRPDGTEDLLFGVGVDYFLRDFAAVVAFALNITCTPDFDLTNRLIHGQHTALGVPHPPRKYIGRVFDPRIEPQDDDGTRLQGFVSNLVGLERQTYNSVMRAIHRYVNGLHRIADDLDLAYALLVASIESLAQEFDAFTPKWEDLDQKKRVPLDKVLSRIPEGVATDVRNELLAHEHVALGRRYREFALEHLRPSFFRDEAIGALMPVQRRDLPKALQMAYEFRSKYVHTLLELPRYLTVSPLTGDTGWVEGKPALTFHGLARVARHVISEFVARAPKCERETFDYRKELPNIFYPPLAFSVWGNWSKNYDHKSARRYLGGFLEDYTAFLTRESNTVVTLTDIQPLIEKVEQLVPRFGKNGQVVLPMLTLYALFHMCFPPEYHRPGREQFFNKYAKAFDAPSIESMLFHVLVDRMPVWTCEQFEETRQAYFKQRYHKNGLGFGPVLEAAVTLVSAELHRREGHEDFARKLVSEAVEDLPGRASLLEFESRMDEDPMPAIRWRDLLLPMSSKAVHDNSKGIKVNSSQALGQQQTHTSIPKTDSNAKRVLKFMLWCSAGVLVGAAVLRWRRP